MKKTILLMALAAFGAFCMTGCSDDDKEKESVTPTLIGTWADTDNPFSKKLGTDCFYTFYKDGSGAYVKINYDADGLPVKISNREIGWTATDNQLTIIPKSDKPISSMGVIYDYQVKEKTLTMHDGSEKKTYKKVSESVIQDIYILMTNEAKVCGLWTAKYAEKKKESLVQKEKEDADITKVTYVEFQDDGYLRQYKVVYDEKGKFKEGSMVEGEWAFVGDKFVGSVGEESFVYFFTFMNYNSFINYLTIIKKDAEVEYTRVSEDDEAQVRADLEKIAANEEEEEEKSEE